LYVAVGQGGFVAFRVFSGVLLFLLVGCAQESGLKFSDGTDGNRLQNVSTIQQLFNQRCVTACHDSVKHKGKTDLSSYESTMKSGRVVPFQPEESDLYTEVESDDMPDDGPPLTAEEKKAIYDWIAAGAPKEWPAEHSPAETLRE
jgi:hypothetical protein